MAEKLATIAWQGVSIKTPEDWSLVGVSGDYKKGYMRVDSPISSAVEVRWSSAMGQPPDLMAKGREFIATLEKSSKKNRTKFSSKIKPEKGVENSVEFSWNSDRLGQGKLIYCPQCDRVVIAQVVSTRDEDVSQVAPAILKSLRDHRKDGLVEWALYGLDVAIPSSYRIEKQVLMSGYLALYFKDHNKQLVIERWGLAETLLGDYAMDEWFRKDVKPDIRGYTANTAETDIKGHEGLVVEGRRHGLKQAMRSILASLTLYPYPGLLTGYYWYCEESNRLFGVRATHMPDEHIAEDVRDFIVCHNKGN